MTNIKAVDLSEIEKIFNKYEGTNGWASILCLELRELLDRSPSVSDDVRKDAWISVEDRLPPLNGDEVLAYRDDDDWIVICLFMDIGFAYFSEQEEQYVTAHAITHWQPLPAPPLDKARE